MTNTFNINPDPNTNDHGLSWPDRHGHPAPLADGVLAFGILRGENFEYVSSSLAPSSKDVSNLVMAMEGHCIVDAMIESKRGSKMRLQVVHPDGGGDGLAVVVHELGHPCAKSTARFARRMLRRPAK